MGVEAGIGPGPMGDGEGKGEVPPAGWAVSGGGVSAVPEAVAGKDDGGSQWYSVGA